MNSYEEFKSFYYSNIILFIIILFVIIYIIINWNFISNGRYWSGDFVKPILISGILFLILHMILTWDDAEYISKNLNQNDIIIPKYKLGYSNEKQINENISVPVNNEPINYQPEQLISFPNTQLKNKYKILNKFETDIKNNLHHVQNSNLLNSTLGSCNKIGQHLSQTDNNINKLSNQNIFLSQKNSNKYGIKFI